MRYRRERRYCYYTVSRLSLRLPVARTEKELKHGFQVVSRRKAVYNETPVEFIPEEGKTRR
ncbi:hypothetical protein T01_5518 [Trichinella spiralis]|uniref:Uncharacterized protein n=1 Tax=Trichinella spiralis TaxID=6334 RepID=A0A0V1BMH7_TRISP|nr:hypothetical protein T01_5518 [Trichinella spiralis]